MGFKMMRADEGVTMLGRMPATVPVAICDICEGLIQDAGMAMVAWDRNAVLEPGLTTDSIVVHKGDCLRACQAEIGDAYVDMELTHVLAFLIHNTRANLDTIRGALGQDD